MTIEMGLLSIKGGYNTRGEAAPCIQYKTGDITHTFVKLDKNAPWFLKGVGGPRIQKGDLKPVQVLGLLRETFDQKVWGEAHEEAKEQPSAVAGSHSEPDEDIDPMEAMDDLVEAVPHANKKPRTTHHNDRAMLEELVVPARPPCVGCDKDDKTVVCVYRKPRSEKRSNGNLFLRVDCIAWLLAYAADELSCQGVVPSSPDPIDRQAGNCSAVAGLHLQWDFTAKAWEAKFVAGALVGTTKAMCVHDLNTDMWGKLKKESRLQNSWSRATETQKKDAAKEFITLWCAAIARNEAAEFEATWGWPSSTHGEKRASEDTAVVSEEVKDTAVADEQVCLENSDTDTAVAA